MSYFTTILWDVDDTLLDFPYSERYALQSCFLSFGLKITEEIVKRYSEINISFWKRLELGEITKQELLPGRFAALFEEYQIQGVDVEAFRARYQEELGNVCSYKDDSITICTELAKSMKQYVITNGVTSTQMKKLKLSGLADVMDGIFISEQIGTPKPQKEYFDYCLAHVEEQDKSKILLVGDSLSSDIKGGVLVGIPTCWYRPEGTENNTEYKPDYEISNLHELYQILGIKA